MNYELRGPCFKREETGKKNALKGAARSLARSGCLEQAIGK